MKTREIVSTSMIWLLIVLTGVLYIRYYRGLQLIGEMIVFMSPILFFSIVGTLILHRDQKIIARTKEKQEFTKTVELDWTMALKHDLLTYFIPVVIMALPLINGQTPDLINVFQAIIAFFALIYLKYTYWNQI